MNLSEIYHEEVQRDRLVGTVWCVSTTSHRMRGHHLLFIIQKRQI